MIGNDGVTPSVSKEIDSALNSHGLIKVRVLGDDRIQRESIFHDLANQHNAAAIQHIGKLLVFWRLALACHIFHIHLEWFSLWS